MIPVPPPSYEQTIEAISACGIPSANIRIAYEDLLQSDVVTISNLGEASEDKFHCLRRAVHPFYLLQIADADQHTAYSSFELQEGRREARVEAIEWLHARGLLDHVPQFDRAEGLGRFALALESACSLAAGSALEAFDASTLAVRATFVEGGLATGASDGVTCLGHMFAASNANDLGIRLGFLGREAASGGVDAHP